MPPATTRSYERFRHHVLKRMGCQPSAAIARTEVQAPMPLFAISRPPLR